jgi:hypothetical protein
VSAVVLGTRPGSAADRPLADLLPIVPTTVRDFTKGDRIAALIRLFANGSPPSGPVQIATQFLGATGSEPLVLPPATIAADAFASTRSADHLIDLPLASLSSGLHLLSVSATFGDSRIVRRDVVFRVR